MRKGWWPRPDMEMSPQIGWEICYLFPIGFIRCFLSNVNWVSSTFMCVLYLLIRFKKVLCLIVNYSNKYYTLILPILYSKTFKIKIVKSNPVQNGTIKMVISKIIFHFPFSHFELIILSNKSRDKWCSRGVISNFTKIQFEQRRA